MMCTVLFEYLCVYAMHVFEWSGNVCIYVDKRKL